MYRSLLAPLILLAACSGDADEANQAAPAGAKQAVGTAAPSADETANTAAPLNPPAPGEPGALPDDRTPVSEAPFTPESAQGAANVLQTYYGLIEDGRYQEAWRLRTPGDGETAAKFAAGFAQYAEYHALVGTPSEISGAAGSLYVEVPVQTYGTLKDGTPFSSAGTVTLRRSNNIPGATPEQLRWRIYTND